MAIQPHHLHSVPAGLTTNFSSGATPSRAAFPQLGRSDRGISEAKALLDSIETRIAGTHFGEIIKLISTGLHPEIRDALKKEEGYFTRFFSSETWDEWLESRSALGKIVDMYLSCTTGIAHPQETLDMVTLEKAQREAQAVLELLGSSAERSSSTTDCVTSLALGAAATIATGSSIPMLPATLSCAKAADAWGGRIGRAISNPVRTVAREAERAISNPVRTVAREAERAVETTAKAVVKEAEKAGKGIAKAAKPIEEGASRLKDHIEGGASNLFKVISGEHKINPKSFKETVKKAKDDWTEEMERAPKEIQLVNAAIKAAITDDPEGTAILLASFIADVYAPGSGEFIRQAYMAHNLAKAGATPEKLIEQLAKGNADQLLSTLVESTYPEYATLAQTAIKGKQAYDRYENNKELIEAAMQGDGKAQALLAQTIIAIHPEVAKQFEAYGVKGEDIVGIQKGDHAAARSLVMGAMKLSVETAAEDVKTLLEHPSPSKEELLVVEEDKYATESITSTSEEATSSSVKIVEEKAKEPTIGSPEPQLRPTSNERIKTAESIADALRQKFRDDSGEAALKHAPSKAGKVLAHGAKAAGKAHDLVTDPESTTIEMGIEFLAKVADKMTKSGGKLAGKMSGGPVSGLAELFSSERLGEGAEYKGEALCKNLGFASCREYDAWLNEESKAEK